MTKTERGSRRSNARSLGARDRRALTLGALILVPALAYTFGVRPAWHALVNKRAEVARERDALARDSALLRREPRLVSDRSTMVEWLSHEARRLFQGPDDIEATSGLAGYVTNAASDAGVRLRQTETRPSIPVTGSLHAVRLAIRAEGDPRAVLTFLAALEGGNHLVRLDHVTIGHVAGLAGGAQSTSPNPRQRGSRAEPAQNQRLALTAEVYGYALLPSPRDVRTLTSEAGASYRPFDALGTRVSHVAAATDATTDADTEIAEVDVSSALAHDPFSPTRGVVPPPPPSAAPTPPPFPIQLVGTVVGRDGNAFAMCQVGDAAPIVVRPGERVAGYRLRDVRRGYIVLVGAHGDVVRLTLPTPGA